MPIQYTTPGVNSKVNYGLWVVMTCQCWFINYKKFSTPLWDVDNEGGCGCVGQGAEEKSL